MKLGIINKPTEQSFISAKEKQLSFLEFAVNVDDNVQSFLESTDELLTYSKKYNIEIGSLGRWGTDKIDKSGNIILEELETTLSLIDATQKLNCPVFNIGVNFVNEISYFQNIYAAMDFLTQVCNHAKTKNVNVAVYNCRWNNYINSPKTWEIFHGNLPELGIKFDPSHCIYDGGNHIEEIKDWGHRFFHVHIKGVLKAGNTRFDDPPAGLDDINWGAFISALRAVNYDKTLAIEPHSKIWKDELGEKGIDFTIKHIKQFLF